MGKRTNEFVKTVIYPFLKQQGYKKIGSTFYKKNDVFIFVLNIQSSTYNNYQNEDFYLNCGIYIPQIALAEGIEPLKAPKEYKCHFRTRNTGITGNSYFSFSINDNTDLTKFKKVIQAELQIIINFFDSIKNTTQILKHSQYSQIPEKYIEIIKKICSI